MTIPQIDMVLDPPLPTDSPQVFDAKANQFGVSMNPLIGKINATAAGMDGAADGTAKSAAAALASATQASNAAQASDASAAQAAKAANANAKTWVSGGVYAVNDVVWADATSGLQFRCILAHSGVSTPPANDPTRWARVGPSSPAPDPTSGPSIITLQRDGAGALTGTTFTQDGKNGTETFTRDAQGRISTNTVAWSGSTRTETIMRDATTGRITSIKVLTINEVLNSAFHLSAWPSEWKTESGSADVATVISEPAAVGGFVLRVGKNTGGNDCIFSRSTKLVKINPATLYRMRYRFRRVAGTGTVYIGLSCRNADNTQYVTANNDVSIFSPSHYALANSAPALGTWQTGEFYFKGNSTGAAGGAGTQSDPKTFAALAGYFALMFAANYNNLSGQADFDYLIVEEILS